MNLYDKYKHQNKLKTERKIVKKTEEIANELGTSQEKLWKNPKYAETEPKFLKPTKVNTLNYQKRADKKAHEERKLKEEVKKNTRQIPEQKANFNNVYQRGKEMAEKKRKLVERGRS